MSNQQTDPDQQQGSRPQSGQSQVPPHIRNLALQELVSNFNRQEMETVQGLLLAVQQRLAREQLSEENGHQKMDSRRQDAEKLVDSHQHSNIQFQKTAKIPQNQATQQPGPSNPNLNTMPQLPGSDHQGRKRRQRRHPNQEKGAKDKVYETSHDQDQNVQRHQTSEDAQYRDTTQPGPSDPKPRSDHQKSDSHHQDSNVQHHQTAEDPQFRDATQLGPSDPNFNNTLQPTGSHHHTRESQWHGFRDRPRNPNDADRIAAQVIYLEQLCKKVVDSCEMGGEEIAEMTAFQAHLAETCRNIVIWHEASKSQHIKHELVTLKCFGSLGAGLATKSSDIDLALDSPHSVPKLSSGESEIPRLLEKRFLEMGYGARLLTRTRVPIIKLCSKPTPELAKALNNERARWENERNQTSNARSQDNWAMVAGRGRVGGFSTQHRGRPWQNHNLQGRSNAPQNPIPTAPYVERSDEELAKLYQIAIAEGWYDNRERKIVRRFIDGVIQQDSTGGQFLIQAARDQLKSVISILPRYRAPYEDPLNFPKAGVGIQCDINFSNPLAIHNTELLKCYSVSDLRVRPIIMFVKQWAKVRKINSSYHGTLPSYGYVLMVLHYLLNVAKPPIAPNLQNDPMAAQDDSPENHEIIDGYSVRFWRKTEEIERRGLLGQLSTNTKDTVGSLLRGFFAYYASISSATPSSGFNWSRDVLSLRTDGGIVSKERKGWLGDKVSTLKPSNPGGEAREVRQRYFMAIEDPFEYDHNIARTVVERGFKAIREEFIRAHTMIESIGKYGKSTPEGNLMHESTKSRENLGRRFFGPPLSDGELEKLRMEQNAYPPSTANAVPIQKAGPVQKEKFSTKKNPIAYAAGMEADGKSDNLTAGNSEENRGSRSKGKQPMKNSLQIAQATLQSQAKTMKIPSQSELSTTGTNNQLDKKSSRVGDKAPGPNKKSFTAPAIQETSVAQVSNTAGEKKRSFEEASAKVTTEDKDENSASQGAPKSRRKYCRSNHRGPGHRPPRIDGKQTPNVSSATAKGQNTNAQQPAKSTHGSVPTVRQETSPIPPHLKGLPHGL